MKLHDLHFSSVPAPPIPADDPRAVAWTDAAGRAVVVAKRIDDRYWFAVPGVGSFRVPTDTAASGLRCVAHPLPRVNKRRVIDAYQRSVLPMVLQAYGFEAMHGSALSLGAGAVVLIGRSHAGKSTLAGALAARGNRLLADDGVVLEVSAADDHEGPPQLRPIPFALMLGADVAGILNRSGPPTDATPPNQPGPLADVEPEPVTAFVLLARTTSTLTPEPVLTRLTPAEAFKELLASAYLLSFDEPERKAQMMRNYLSLARRVPSFRLAYPTDLERLPAAASALENLVARLERSGASPTAAGPTSEPGRTAI